MILVFDSVENIVGKGENAGYSISESLKGGTVVVKV